MTDESDLSLFDDFSDCCINVSNIAKNFPIGRIRHTKQESLTHAAGNI